LRSIFKVNFRPEPGVRLLDHEDKLERRNRDFVKESLAFPDWEQSGSCWLWQYVCVREDNVLQSSAGLNGHKKHVL